MRFERDTSEFLDHSTTSALEITTNILTTNVHLMDLFTFVFSVSKPFLTLSHVIQEKRHRYSDASRCPNSSDI